mgnify:CR=1 FL=1
MLSKSGARTFFLVGTFVCAGAFILLTLDTLKRVPGQTREENITAEVIRGKNLWEKNNCMGCHTILGEGAYYAPELTKVYDRRGIEFIRSLLKDPEAMYPEQRKMVKYNFTDSEISDLVAFFKWIGEMDLNGFPAKPPLAVTGNSLANSFGHAKMPIIYKNMCTSCHSLGGSGGNVGPALDVIGDKLNAEEIMKWLRDPMALKADSKMPKLPLTEEQIAELAGFLSQFKSGEKK